MSTVREPAAGDSGSTALSTAGRFDRSLNARLALATFLGALLLFQVQPLIGKILLPWYGGTPAVWTTALLFFQWLLVAGYAFAHFLARFLSPAARSYVFVLAAVAVVFLLPIGPDAADRPTADARPIAHLLGLLLISVGGPYFVLAATSPTMQEWFRRANPGGSPYRLYALSNAGSLLGLVTYPFLIERFWDLPTQSLAWSVLFGAFVVVAATCAWSVRGRLEPAEATDRPGPKAAASRGRGRAIEETPVTAGGAVVWIGLAAAGTTLLMSATNLLCQDVAPVPFLWVAPLVVYLLTFIIAFERPRFYRRTPYAAAAVVLVPWAAVQAVPFSSLEQSKLWFVPNLMKMREISFGAQITVVLLMLLVTCMLCHGELAARKPSPRHATLYLLLISLGGALGGLLTAVVAPTMFHRNWEWIVGTTVAMAASVALLGPLLESALKLRKPLYLAVGATAVLSAASFMAWLHSLAFSPHEVAVARNFYGTIAVDVMPDPQGRPGYAVLRSGSTLHGIQILDNKLIFPDKNPRRVATGYYGVPSGVGTALVEARRLGRPLRVGVIGLGVGTLATYGRERDEYDFYEINPAVERFAREYFTYLADSHARCNVILGDARTALERADAELRYDVLVLDAFTSDSIPPHLLTAEAIELYLRHLSDDGILAVHMSNTHLNLEPVVAAAAEHFRLAALHKISGGNAAQFLQGARWAVLTRRPESAAWAQLRRRGFVDLPKPSIRLWTDQHNNQFDILRGSSEKEGARS